MSDAYDVISTRQFKAPVAEVWRAWSEPSYVSQWWGPDGFTSPSAELDFRVGGTSLVCMRAPADYGGQDFYNTWTYRRIEPVALIEFDNGFADANGATVTNPRLDLSSVWTRWRHCWHTVALGRASGTATGIAAGLR